ncbi:MAG TPA: tRNA (adenosine(37)-N6)-threonylcarbamoyltransferase complex ATPase subunit type 1 TsaE [Candidatus Paceibacterota bacterium]|nr:tRNA (adenosine(37)-N6)-threonylcarbamoyltransferase complex ATPase subunit type 1 TsaE [Candidatus Paceibacterota bacterium]
MDTLAEYQIFSLEKIDSVAETILDVVGSHYSGKGAFVITLSGDLGAGKTALTQAIARKLGVTENVSSPTFVVQKTYPLSTPNPQGFTQLIHIDAYRIENQAEAEVLKLQELLHTQGVLFIIEWPEKLPSFRVDMRIELAHAPEVGEDTRSMNVVLM